MVFACSMCCKQYLLENQQHTFFKDQIINLNANKTTFLLYLVMWGGDITMISYQYDINSVLIS